MKIKRLRTNGDDAEGSDNSSAEMYMRRKAILMVMARAKMEGDSDGLGQGNEGDDYCDWDGDYVG